MSQLSNGINISSIPANVFNWSSGGTGTNTLLNGFSTNGIPTDGQTIVNSIKEGFSNLKTPTTLDYLNFGLSGITGLYGLYNSMQQNKLAKQQLAYQKGLANTNLYNQAKTINNNYDSNARLAYALSGNYTPENKANYEQIAANQHVKTSI